MADQPTNAELKQRVQAVEAAIAAKRGNSYSAAKLYHPHRTAPYPYHSPTRGRANTYGYHGPSRPYRNRSLVNPRSSRSLENNPPSTSNNVDQSNDEWVSKREYSMQLINKNVYEKRTVEENSTSETASFQGNSPAAFQTGAQIAPHSSSSHGYQTRSKPVKTEHCRTFCSTGECRRGPACHFLHDPSKVAICKEFLSKGTCLNGPSCNLSHDLTPNRVPTCFHFTRGNCRDGSNCRYAHVKVSQNASVCPSFAKLGYCEAGAECPSRHVYECPDYAATGRCVNRGCRLDHIDRAGQLRQTAPNTTQPSGATNVNDLGNTNPVLDSLDAALNSSVNSTGSDSNNDGSTSSDKDQAQYPSATESTFTQEHNFLSLNDDSDDMFRKKFQSDD